MRYKFNDKSLKKILDNLIICVDSREQRNSHITDFFKSKNINYKVEKLPFGDYSIMMPKGSFEGQVNDIYFYDDIVIERKNGIDEIAGNLKEDASRLKKELAHLNKYNIRYFIFIEDENYHKNIRCGNYRSLYEPNTLYQRIKKGIEAEYNTIVVPVGEAYIGSEIYNTLVAFVYNKLKHEGWIEEGEKVE